MSAESGRIVSRRPPFFKMKVFVFWVIYLANAVFIFASDDTLVIQVFGLIFYFVLLTILTTLEFRIGGSIHYCHMCGSKIGKKMNFKNNPKIKVISTTQSSKAVTSISPGLALGSVGRKRAGGVTINSTTSHIPVVLGKVEARVSCPIATCKAINKWKFRTEVEVWTDTQDGSQSFKVVGKKKPPTK